MEVKEKVANVHHPSVSPPFHHLTLSLVTRECSHGSVISRFATLTVKINDYPNHLVTEINPIRHC
jgi:hypothetical protein